jgi:hypothetical protein
VPIETGAVVTVEVNEANTQDSYFFPFQETVTFPRFSWKQVPSPGIFFQLSNEKTVTNRRVHSIYEWASQIGGFICFLYLCLAFLLPYLQVWTIEKLLINRLYKQSMTRLFA